MHWIRARGQKDRWREEFVLTTYEMEWTVRYFLGQLDLWISRNRDAKINGLDGAAAYASRKMLMWMTMAHDAEAKFISINPNHYRLLDRLPQIIREGSRG